MSSYWSKQVEAEQLVDDPYAARRLLEKLAFQVTLVEGTDGTFLLYERPGETKPTRGFVRPGEWVSLTSSADGRSYAQVRPTPPSGPLVGARS